MKRKFIIVVIIIFVFAFMLVLGIYLSADFIIKKSVTIPIETETNMYVVYYDYYGDSWSITEGNGIDCSKMNLAEIIKGPDPKKELSVDVWSCNSFIIYGTIQKIEKDNFCDIYNLYSTGWDVAVQNGSEIYRRNADCRPDVKNGLTIYDYKWFDVIAQTDDYILNG